MKFSLYEMPETKEIVNGYVEKIGNQDSFYTLKYNGKKQEKQKKIMNHTEAVSTMIEELLDKTCYKQYKEISFLDVDKNENEILYHVKRAIHYGATRSLYYEQAAEYNMSALENLKVELNPPKQERLTTDEVKDYFGDLFI